MKHKFYPLLTVLLLSLLFLSGCKKQQSEQSGMIDPNIVTLEQATALVTEISSVTKTKLGEMPSVFTNVENITTYNDRNGSPNFYVINYQDGNFLILAADKRIDPILAYSTDGKFDNSISNRPDGLQMWMDELSGYIGSIRSGVTKVDTPPTKSWTPESISSSLLARTTRPSPGDFDKPMLEGCPQCPASSIVWPFLSTQWDQEGAGYNDYCPYLTCNGIHWQSVAGCAPVAVAQVMYYNKYPSNYNWSAMGRGGSDATARLLVDVGAKMYASYNCGATSTFPRDMVNALRTMGYRVTQQEYNEFFLRNILKNGDPVILSAQLADKSGHAWVCAGYTYAPECAICGRAKINTLYMNWGWGGLSDGHYSANVWSVDGDDFINDKTMYSIYPNL